MRLMVGALIKSLALSARNVRGLLLTLKVVSAVHAHRLIDVGTSSYRAASTRGSGGRRRSVMRVMRKIMIALFAGTVIGFVPMFAEQAEAQRFGGRGGGGGIGRVGIGGGGIGRVGIARAGLAVASASVVPAGAVAALVGPDVRLGAAAVGAGPDAQAWLAPPGGAGVQGWPALPGGADARAGAAPLGGADIRDGVSGARLGGVLRSHSAPSPPMGDLASDGTRTTAGMSTCATRPTAGMADTGEGEVVCC